MDYDPCDPFITSMLELKLSTHTMFEWQKYSQEAVEVPPYQKLLEFLDWQAQAAEASGTDSLHQRKSNSHSYKKGTNSKQVTSYAVSVNDHLCVVCNIERYPLYACSKFKSLSHDEKESVQKANDLHVHVCLNCLKRGHSAKNCRSLHRCRVCQKAHHSLMHIEFTPNPSVSPFTVGTNGTLDAVTSHIAHGHTRDPLLMTCRLLVKSPDGPFTEARGFLDSGSSVSFITERLVQTLGLACSTSEMQVLGIAGIIHPSTRQTVTSFMISPIHCRDKSINLSAVVIPQVTCELPISAVPYSPSWKHL